MSVIRHTFSKKNRLTGKKSIDALFSGGRYFFSGPFKIIWLAPNETNRLQAGVGVSSRYFKKAVDRNRIKRLIKETYRTQKHELEQVLTEKNSGLSLFILFSGREVPVYEDVCIEIRKIISRLKDMAHANHKTNT